MQHAAKITIVDGRCGEGCPEKWTIHFKTMMHWDGLVPFNRSLKGGCKKLMVRQILFHENKHASRAKHVQECFSFCAIGHFIILQSQQWYCSVNAILRGSMVSLLASVSWPHLCQGRGQRPLEERNRPSSGTSVGLGAKLKWSTPPGLSQTPGSTHPWWLQTTLESRETGFRRQRGGASPPARPAIVRRAPGRASSPSRPFPRSQTPWRPPAFAPFYPPTVSGTDFC